MNDDIRKRALDLYRPPFRYENGYIWDAKGKMVADSEVESDIGPRVRGWGRMKYLPDPERLYEETGRAIAEAMTIGWESLRAAPPEPSGMRPGERCVLMVHSGAQPHSWDQHGAAFWSEDAIAPHHIAARPRCPYVQPSPNPPTCANCGGSGWTRGPRGGIGPNCPNCNGTEEAACVFGTGGCDYPHVCPPESTANHVPCRLAGKAP